MKNSPVSRVLENAIFSYQVFRALNFAAQQFSLPLIEKLLYSDLKLAPVPYKPTRSELEILFRELLSLLKKDSQNLVSQDVPITSLRLDSPVKPWIDFLRILADGRKIQMRRKKNLTKDFNPTIEQELDQYPEYYQRNFHFQTDGYLSEDSADLYDAQVDLLFSGATGAMRRQILPLLKRQKSLDEIKRPQFLEVGTGLGNLTLDISKAYPKANILGLDLSRPYLEKAKIKVPGLNTMVGAGEDLPFKDENFDLVFSCFLFHELPRKVRILHLEEAFRVLRPGGLLALVDSLQKDDDPRLNWALELFPRSYHEPFYKDYTLTPLKALAEGAGFVVKEETHGFLAKALVAVKPASRSTHSK